MIGIEAMDIYSRPDINLLEYACPQCKGQLNSSDTTLMCQVCHRAYPIHDSIPDFISDEIDRSPSPLLQWANHYYDWQALTYEWTRFPLRPILYGGIGAPSLRAQVRKIINVLPETEGLVLDVASGPGTLARRIAAHCKAVHAIDLSVGMLRRGVTYVRRGRIDNVRFARAKVEALPFRDDWFDAAVCGAALQVFGDPVVALQEISRVLKRGAPLTVITVVAGERGGIFRLRHFREKLQRRGLHVFTISDLERYVAEAGLQAFRADTYGSLIIFHTWKQET